MELTLYPMESHKYNWRYSYRIDPQRKPRDQGGKGCNDWARSLGMSVATRKFQIPRESIS